MKSVTFKESDSYACMSVRVRMCTCYVHMCVYVCVKYERLINLSEGRMSGPRTVF